MSSKDKGFDFERQLCVRMSEWASYGVRDDVFWRTAGSGGRATTRLNMGRTLEGQYGDIGATHPDYKVFTDSFVWELKRGYNKANAHDLFDATTTKERENNELMKFFRKTITTATRAGAVGWCVVARRDRRRSLFWFDGDFFSQLVETGRGALPINAELRLMVGSISVVAITEDDFFEIDPNVFRNTIAPGADFEVP